MSVNTHCVTVRLAAPASGVDLETGETFESTLHRIHAEQLLQDASSSIFISEYGEVVAEWPTELVTSVKWGRRVEPEALVPSDELMREREPLQKRLREQLESWRSELAQKQDVRSSSILSNAGIDEIVDALPQSRREFQSLRNVQPKQRRRHWKEIVQLVEDAFVAVDARPGGVCGGRAEAHTLSAESIDSLPEAVRRRFEIRVAAYGRFESPGWFYVGMTVTDCPDCGEPLEGFRRPYSAGGKTYHYWALVCLRCKSMFEPAELEPKARLELYASSDLRPYPNE